MVRRPRLLHFATQKRSKTDGVAHHKFFEAAANPFDKLMAPSNGPELVEGHPERSHTQCDEVEGSKLYQCQP